MTGWSLWTSLRRSVAASCRQYLKCLATEIPYQFLCAPLRLCGKTQLPLTAETQRTQSYAEKNIVTWCDVKSSANDADYCGDCYVDLRPKRHVAFHHALRQQVDGGRQRISIHLVQHPKP